MAESLTFISEMAEKQASSVAGAIASRKKKALDIVLEKGIPGRMLEAWKYTDGNRFIAERDGIARGDASADTATLIEKALPVQGDCYRIVFQNGKFQGSLSSEPQAGSFELRSLLDGGQNERGLDRLGASAVFSENVFANLNLACATSVVSIRIPRGVQLDRPVVIYSCITSDAARSMTFPRVVVEVEESAAVDIVEVAYAERDDIAYSAFSVAETFVAANARLSYTHVNRHSKNAYVFNALSGDIAKDAALQTGVFTFGGQTSRNEIFATLSGENCRSDMLGLTVLDERQHVDNHTVVDHAMPHCESYEMFKGIYDGSSKGIFDGTIIVRPDAQKTNAIQSNQSLLLSDSATSNSKPQLKIWADDVKCTHGATVGQLDEHALFYARSRGIPAEAARAMLIHAFASEVVKDIRLAFLKESLEMLLSEKLSATA